MRDFGPFHLEVAGECATLYVHQPLGMDTCASLVEVCAALPSAVRTLRLDFRAMGAMTSDANGVVRFLLAYWRTTRGGEFRLCTSHLLATYAPDRAIAPSVPMMPFGTTYGEAMTAAFL